MKVDPLDSSSSIRKLKQKKQSSIGGFSLPDDDNEEDEEITSVTTAHKIPSLNPFLALQEVSNPEYESSEHKKIIEEGETLLNYLKQILLGLINGDLNEYNIRNLKDIIEHKKYSFTAPEAQKLYDEIYLRASVELAKLERSRKA
ncbi:MAG: flagellar assembly protein FliX [Rickettsiaceae bacterium]|jgi:hypothetical protein|nr:flagellar assembly protein FliX [Rickettsiaceae bacterium]